MSRDAHSATAGNALSNAYDATKPALKLETDRRHVVRQMIDAYRKGGTIVIMGVHAALVDKFPLGIAFNKGLHFHMGQMRGPKYILRLFDYTRRGQVDPSFVFTHRFCSMRMPFLRRDGGFPIHALDFLQRPNLSSLRLVRVNKNLLKPLVTTETTGSCILRSAGRWSEAPESAKGDGYGRQESEDYRNDQLQGWCWEDDCDLVSRRCPVIDIKTPWLDV